mmetsp:Transcript_88739/g.157190  ORF Transcript_88739/g.157190 Transcript_88739/m.157190 type:complete len:352 (+) Transcript_88739:56-1111(+)
MHALLSPRSPADATCVTPRSPAEPMTPGRGVSGARGEARDFLETARGPRSEENPNIKYVGDRVNGKKHGRGVQMWVDGRKYNGQFKDGQFHGSGAMAWPDGRTYRGQYAEGYKHGEGIFTWPDGRMYSGEWVRGRRHGRGMYVNAKGESGEGLWADDRPCTWSKSSMDTFQSTSASRQTDRKEVRAPTSCSTMTPTSELDSPSSPPCELHGLSTPMSSQPLPTLLESGVGNFFTGETPLNKAVKPWDDRICEERSRREFPGEDRTLNSTLNRNGPSLMEMFSQSLQSLLPMCSRPPPREVAEVVNTTTSGLRGPDRDYVRVGSTRHQMQPSPRRPLGTFRSPRQPVGDPGE